MKRLVSVATPRGTARRWGGQAVGDDFHGGTVGTVADILGGAWGAAKGGRGASGEHFHGGTCGNPR